MGRSDFAEQFRKWDENSDGRIEYADFVRALLQDQYELPQEDIERVGNMKPYELYDV